MVLDDLYALVLSEELIDSINFSIIDSANQIAIIEHTITCIVSENCQRVIVIIVFNI